MAAERAGVRSGGVVEWWRTELECEVHGIATTWKSSWPLFRALFNPPVLRPRLGSRQFFKMEEDQWTKQPASRLLRHAHMPRRLPAPTRSVYADRFCPSFPNDAAGPACAARRRQPQDPRCIAPAGRRVFLRGPYLLWRRN
jgi:hypothetical protein